MAFTPDFIDDVRSRITLSAVIGKRVKLTRKGRRHSGLCPFHNEKTPSFSVNDDEGYYYCFGCGAGGDAISYLRESEGLDFTEAVKRLAEMAGVPIPDQRPIDPVKQKRRQSVMEALEAASHFYRQQLETDAAGAARRYLAQRGLSAATLADFQIGYAPRQGLRAHLLARGFDEETLVTAGLCGRSDRDNSLYDYFRDRIIYPICNRQGAVIAFGARAMGDAMPKYLNSPDGPTFAKKAVLYGWGQARERVRRNLPLLVVEGYMDVIAVSAAHAGAALAPLGTALTEQQIALVWKLHDEPVLCFDGDRAGQQAALRAIERILPVLEPGKSVRIAVMPTGKDPDDILADEGVEALKAIIASAASLTEALWTQMAQHYNVSDPAGRTAFFQQLRDLVKTISHTQTRQSYGDEIEYRIAGLRAQLRSGGASAGRAPMMRPARRPQTGARMRLVAMLALLTAHPSRIADHYEELSLADFAQLGGDKRLEDAKKEILDAVIRDADLDGDALRHHLQETGHSQILSECFGNDMVSRLGAPPQSLANEKVDRLIADLMARLPK